MITKTFVIRSLLLVTTSHISRKLPRVMLLQLEMVLAKEHQIKEIVEMTMDLNGVLYLKLKVMSLSLVIFWSQSLSILFMMKKIKNRFAMMLQLKKTEVSKKFIMKLITKEARMSRSHNFIKVNAHPNLKCSVRMQIILMSASHQRNSKIPLKHSFIIMKKLLPPHLEVNSTNVYKLKEQ